jgi:hypothetical protein
MLIYPRSNLALRALDLPLWMKVTAMAAVLGVFLTSFIEDSISPSTPEHSKLQKLPDKKRLMRSGGGAGEAEQQGMTTTPNTANKAQSPLVHQRSASNEWIDLTGDTSGNCCTYA